MSRRTDLKTRAVTFARSISTLLNSTVCDTVRINAIIRGPNRAVLGTGLSNSRGPQPVTLRAAGNVPMWLTVAYRAFQNHDGFLTVEASAFTVSAVTPEDELFHYDYERDKVDYPDAHVQIRATSPTWDAVLAASGKHGGSLHKLHLPVGGRRYRPALEDIIEALVMEGILAPRSNWQKIVDVSREEFRMRQLAAAVHRHPEIAAQALRNAGYSVSNDDGVTKQLVDLSVLRIRKRN